MIAPRWPVLFALCATTVPLAQAQAPDRAVLIADLLARADLADAQGGRVSRRELTRTVAALDRMAVRADPSDDAGAATLAGWRTKTGTQAVTERGRVLGPAFRRGWLTPGGALSVDQLFLAGRSANVAVAATPGQDVKLVVSGPDAAPACAGRSCRWTPIFTQRYTITLRNAGMTGARYYLVVD